MKYFSIFNVSRYTIIQINFFWEVSHLSNGLFSSLIKFLSILSITSSFLSFIVSFCSLILLLPNIASSEGLLQQDYLGMIPVFPDMLSSWSVSS